MNRQPVRARLVCSFALVALCVGLAAGQRAGDMKKKEGRGRLVGGANGLFQVMVDENKAWVLKPLPQSQITFRGKADKSWLQPGMFVRFETTVDSDGNGQEPITELVVAIPIPGTIGITMEDEEEREEEGEHEGEAAEETEDEGGEELHNFCTVAANITKVTENGIEVRHKRDRISAEIAKNVAIEVEIADYSWARPGDKVHFSALYQAGKQPDRNRPGFGIINTMVITAQNKLQGTEPKPRSRRNRRTSRRKQPAAENSETNDDEKSESKD